MRPPTVFRSLFSLLVRVALDEQFGKGGYGASLDGLVQALNGERRKRQLGNSNKRMQYKRHISGRLLPRDNL
jgi:hypothetical protein